MHRPSAARDGGRLGSTGIHIANVNFDRLGNPWEVDTFLLKITCLDAEGGRHDEPHAKLESMHAEWPYTPTIGSSARAA